MKILSKQLQFYYIKQVAVIAKTEELKRVPTCVNMAFAFDSLSLVDISLAAKLSAIDTTT